MGLMNIIQATQCNRQVNGQRLRGNSGLINIERNQGKQQQVSNQTQMGTHELMMTEQGQEGPYTVWAQEKGRETQDMGIQV